MQRKLYLQGFYFLLIFIVGTLLTYTQNLSWDLTGDLLKNQYVWLLLIFGSLGMLIEIAWTAFQNNFVKRIGKGKPVEWNLTGKTYLWMFSIYGLGGLTLMWLSPNLAELHWFLRGLVYTVIIFSIEAITGLLLLAAIGKIPWDYRPDTDTALFWGAIRWDYAPAWFVLAVGFEALILPFVLLIIPSLIAVV